MLFFVRLVSFPHIVLPSFFSFFFFCSCEVCYHLMGPLCVVLCQVGIDFLTWFFNPVFLRLFHGFLYVAVYFSVPTYSMCVMFLFLQLSPFITHLKDIICDPFLLLWSVFPQYSHGCVSDCCGKKVPVSVSRSSSPLFPS